jgi:hypothetical protein
LRAYFSKGDPIAAALARRCGLQLHVGLDRFYAEIRLATASPGAARANQRFAVTIAAPSPAAPVPASGNGGNRRLPAEPHLAG